MRERIALILGVVLILGAVPEATVFAAENTMLELRSLVESAQKAYEAKDYPKAISLLEKARAAMPHPMFEYNLACAYALTGDSEKALLHLEKAVDLGFIDADHIEKDSDLGTVRKSPNYSKILRKARAATEAQQKSLANVPAPQDIILPAKGKEPGERGPLLIFLHGMGSSPGELKAAFEPLATSWKYTVFLPSGSMKLGIRPDGKPAYNWDANNDVRAIVEKIKKTPGIDPKQIYLGGFSAGANMAYVMAFDSPELFAGVIAFSGGMQEELMSAEKIGKASGKVPFYIVHGKKDEMMPIWLGRDARDYLKKKGFRVILREFDGGHTFPDNHFDVLKEAIQWFHKQP